MCLTDISVNYVRRSMDGIRQWNAVSVIMTLRFNELSTIYNTDYSPDVVKEGGMMKTDNLGDLFPVSFIRQDDPAVRR